MSDRKCENMTVGMADAFGAGRLDRAAAIRSDGAFYAGFFGSQPGLLSGGDFWMRLRVRS